MPSITLLIILVTSVISFSALSNTDFLERLTFYPYRIWRTKEFYRFISAGLIHSSFAHLFVNMLTLYFFGEYIESAFDVFFGLTGRMIFVVLYFTAIMIADLPNFFLKKNDETYRSVGASGGTSAIVFAFILIQPMATLYVWFFPVKAILFGLLYLIYSAYMARQGNQRIGHLAHLTGSVYGLLFLIVLKPGLIQMFIYQILSYFK